MNVLSFVRLNNEKKNTWKKLLLKHYNVLPVTQLPSRNCLNISTECCMTRSQRYMPSAYTHLPTPDDQRYIKLKLCKSHSSR